jgi:hypothetical protein
MVVVNRYEWHPWFAWFPVFIYRPHPVPFPQPLLAWCRWVECRVHGEVAPNGDLTEWWEYR